MRISKFSIIATLLCITSCVDIKYYIPNDKGIVVGIQKDVNHNNVTIMLIKDSVQRNEDTYITFPTHKHYSINDTVYFTN